MVRKIIVLGLVSLFIACSKEDGDDKNIFKKFDDPIITDNDFFPGSKWNDPYVINDGGKLVMYASADKGSAEDIKIYRLESDNGIDWILNPNSAVLEKGEDEDAWDRKSTETPAVVYFNNKYHLFYTAYPQTQYDISSHKIGHATSVDGMHFERDGTFLLAPTGAMSTGNEFYQFIVTEPAPVVFNNELYLYFSASGYTEKFQNTLQVIGVIKSSDGENWTDPKKVLEPNQELYPRDTYAGYSAPHATVINNHVHLFFDVVIESFQQIYIDKAISGDGMTDWVHDDKALIHKDDFTWTSLEVNGPSALVHDEKLYLWFAGNNNKNLGIGLVIFDLD